MRSFDDCQAGDKVRTAGRTVTEADVVLFAAFSGDWQALHTDAYAAREGPFGERVAHGMLSLTAGLNLLFRHGGFGNGLLPDGPIIIARMDNIRFLRPVKIGDSLYLECEIVDKTRLDDGQATLGLRFDILNQANEPAVSGRLRVLAAGGSEAT